MFNPSRTVIDAFVVHTLGRYREVFPKCDQGHEEILEQAVVASLETLLNCDCPYHDMEHTILVTDVGESILQGRQISQGDVSPSQWLHTVLACLFHDIGYLRGLLKQDRENAYIADEADNRVSPPPGATDACLMPYHVTRSCIFVHERYALEPLVDVPTVTSYIEMTRFPVPEDKHYQQTDSFAALVRAADLIGQMGDPLYIQKLSRLYRELLETGEAERLGYRNAGELRADYPEFFNDHVYPYITEGLRFLRKTQDGQQWIANLFHHLHNEQENEPGWGPERGPHVQTTNQTNKPHPRPHIAISNR
ncbi:MAG: metal-dependent phosphohydrolase [Gammaproteobacteria bacterium]|nr:metal-dependent phosphohydrolase [Gammaproteobacteria bacterium]